MALYNKSCFFNTVYKIRFIHTYCPTTEEGAALWLLYSRPSRLNSIHGILMGWGLVKAPALIILVAKMALLMRPCP